MSRATLEFDLPEESHEFNWAVNGWKYSSLIFDYDQALRAAVKYETVSSDLLPGIEWARDKLWDLLRDNNIDPYEE